MKNRSLTFVSFLLLASAGMADVDRFNYILGTHSIGSNYQFTDKTRLIETAEVILGLGSNIMKFRLSKDFAKRNYAGPNPEAYDSLKDLAENEPSIRAVFEMPFYYYFMWVTSLQGVKWADKEGYTEKDAETEYREIYDLASHLLTTYNGSGKHFYFGHWEGDWLLVNGFNNKMDPIPHRVENMIKWLNNRQRAVDDAKRDYPDSDVKLYHYSEVNQVIKGLRGGKCYTTEVLPHVNVDYVSYSAYDAQLKPEGQLPDALDYIERHLPKKKDIPGKRVWIGEFGYKAKGNTPDEVKTKSLQFAQLAVEWGCPYVLHWQLYDNEFENGEYNGFWLIDNHGVKQPLFYALGDYFSSARRYISGHLNAEGCVPLAGEFRKKAVKVIQKVKETD
jgi:hypothetical protein